MDSDCLDCEAVLVAYIESHQTLLGHPKTRKAARLLGIKRVHLVGHLHALWWWSLDYADDGDLSRYESDVIADACEWEDDPDTFIDALVSAGFLSTDDDGALHVHDWMDYAGRLVQRRKANAQRMRDARAANVQNTCETHADTCEAIQDNQTVTDQTQPNTTKPDRDIAPPRVIVSDTPYSVYAAFIEETAEPDFTPAPKWKEKQIGIAKRLLEQGYGDDKVRRCVQFMKSQVWRTSPFDLGGVEGYIGTWEAAGMPDFDKPKRGSSTKRDAVDMVGDLVRSHAG